MTKESIRVLMIEDDEDDYLLTVETFDDVEGSDYEVTWCRSFTELREITLEGNFDVALVDFRLGAHNGLDVLRHLSQADRTLPCIMLTGQTDRAADRQAMALGAADYLVKGQFQAETIERSIRYAIDSATVLASLRDSEARFRSVVESATDGIVLLDNDAKILAVNRAGHELMGRPGQNLIGEPGLNFLTAASASRLLGAIDRITERGGLTGENTESVNSKAIEAHVTHRSGRLVPVELTVSSWVSANQRFWSVIVRDVTERKAMSDKLAYQAFHDPLTGLANRTLLKEKVAERFLRYDSGRGVPGVIFVDLDNFKLVNDTFGHEAGDELLMTVSKRLVECVRDSDVVARLGGDEFAVFLDSVASAQAAGEVADRLIQSLNEPVEVGGIPVVASGSAGVALGFDPNISVDDLLRNADVAMYSAKSAGKNRMAIFEDSMHDASIERMRIEHDLRASLAEDGVGVAYQPIICLSTNQITGFEALARWTHKDRGSVPPSVFIAVAEDAGLIEELGRSVMQRAVTETAELQQRLGVPFRVNVNLSTRQLEDDKLVETARNLLLETGLVPGSLTIEVTESVMVGHVDRAISVLNQLRDLEVKLALDDFGTGYSSLSYLHLLPLDSLKADRSFVTRHGDSAGEGLLRAIVAIGESLNLYTVAEGIEDEAEHEAVKRLGYDYGQGYLFSKPVALAELTELLEAQHVHH